MARKEDFGVNDTTFIVNTHLGNILNFNDTVLAYDLTAANISGVEDYQDAHEFNQDIIIVKKTFPKLRKRTKQRYWKLKHFEEKEDEEMADEEVEEDEDAPVARKKTESKRQQKKKQRQAEKADPKNNKDYEYFLQDLEDDEEFRQNVNLYKDMDVIAQLEQQIG